MGHPVCAKNNILIFGWRKYSTVLAKAIHASAIFDLLKTVKCYFSSEEECFYPKPRVFGP
jgi:hypothetical protein